MINKLHPRQTASRDLLQQLFPNVADQELDLLLRSINFEVTPPLRTEASNPSSLVINVGPSIVSNTEAGRNKSISHIQNGIPVLTSGTVTLPASDGGTITVSPGTNATLTCPSNNYVKILMSLDSTGNIVVTQGTADPVEANALVPANPTNTLAFAYVSVFNNAGTIQNVAQNKIYQIQSGGSTGSSPTFITATGGTITTDGNYKVHTFTSSGTFQITAGSGFVDSLVIAGGGGGGGDNGTSSGGGGGAGGLTYTTGSSYGVGSFTVTIGAGGSGAVGGTSGSNGSSSVFDTITATGGGGGAGSAGAATNGIAGGSGGGGNGRSGGGTGGAGTGGQGHNGGSGNSTGSNAGGGGGGSGSNAGNATTSVAGNGGTGTSNSITGSAVFYASGGGGGVAAGGTPGSASAGGGGTGALAGTGSSATSNTGGGGGGGDNGGNGGSGVVIIRYQFQ